MPKKRILWNIALLPVSGLGSYIISRVLAAWGIFDPIADVLGGWLKMHISPSAMLNIVALVTFFGLYGFSLWVMRRAVRAEPISEKESAVRREVGDNIQGDVTASIGSAAIGHHNILNVFHSINNPETRRQKNEFINQIDKLINEGEYIKQTFVDKKDKTLVE
jgi:hypothetical protein